MIPRYYRRIRSHYRQLVLIMSLSIGCTPLVSSTPGFYPIPTSAAEGVHMNELPKEMYQNWLHSFEEDTDDLIVYRKAQHVFPPARGRAGIGFRPDGTFIDSTIAPADGSKVISGHWHVERPGYVRINPEAFGRASWVLEIIHVDSDVLKVRRHQTSP